MSEDIFDDSLKNECILFWKEFIMWLCILILLAIVFILIAIVIYCIINFT